MILLIVMLNAGCDQVSKTIVRKEVDYYEIISLIDHRLTLTKVENTGAFLSAGSSLPYFFRLILLTLVPLVFLTYGLYQIVKNRDMSKMLLTGWCFVIGGGIGNLYDRIVHGSVTDFLHLDLGVFQTGIFNMADVSIMLGMLLILTGQFLLSKDRQLSI